MPAHDAQPIRPGAAPTLTLSAIGSACLAATSQPVWVRMTEVLVRWLRHHFSVATRIEYPNVADRVWTAGESSPILITSLAEWRPTQAGERPSVLVDRLDQETDPSHRVVGMRYQGIKPGYMYDFIGGQHVVHCTGGKEGEAEYLAAEVWRELKKFGSVVEAYLGLKRFTVLKVSKRAQLSDDYKECYSVAVPVAYWYEEQWRLYPTDETPITQIVTILDGA